MTNLDRLHAAVAEINERSHHQSEVEAPDAQGIRWAWMGHNASHTFELGVDAEDRVWRRASGEDFDQEGFEAAGSPEDREYEFVRWRTDDPTLVEGGFAGVGYIGHW
jgi:hypothetical protein